MQERRNVDKRSKDMTYLKTDTGTDVPWKHCAERKKPVTKKHILYNFIYVKCPE